MSEDCSYLILITICKVWAFTEGRVCQGSGGHAKRLIAPVAQESSDQVNTYKRLTSGFSLTSLVVYLDFFLFVLLLCLYFLLPFFCFCFVFCFLFLFFFFFFFFFFFWGGGIVCMLFLFCLVLFFLFCFFFCFFLFFFIFVIRRMIFTHSGFLWSVQVQSFFLFLLFMKNALVFLEIQICMNYEDEPKMLCNSRRTMFFRF